MVLQADVLPTIVLLVVIGIMLVTALCCYLHHLTNSNNCQHRYVDKMWRLAPIDDDYYGINRAYVHKEIVLID
jgi:hypothetical protein